MKCSAPGKSLKPRATIVLFGTEIYLYGAAYGLSYQFSTNEKLFNSTLTFRQPVTADFLNIVGSYAIVQIMCSFAALAMLFAVGGALSTGPVVWEACCEVFEKDVALLQDDTAARLPPSSTSFMVNSQLNSTRRPFLVKNILLPSFLRFYKSFRREGEREREIEIVSLLRLLWTILIPKWLQHKKAMYGSL